MSPLPDHPIAPPSTPATASTVHRSEIDGLRALGLLLVPVALYDAATPFPGLAAVPPVVGTAIVLAFVGPKGWAGRVLTLRAVLWLGLFSYSAYLWHQPLLAFARLAQPGAAAPWLLGAMAALSLLLGHLSWRFVEAPFRDRQRWSRRANFQAAGAATTAIIAIGVVIFEARPRREADAAANTWSKALRARRPTAALPLAQCHACG